MEWAYSPPPPILKIPTLPLRGEKKGTHVDEIIKRSKINWDIHRKMNSGRKALYKGRKTKEHIVI